MKREKPIYLDYNATTPHDPEVVEAMKPYLEEHFGNPSSSHRFGLIAKEAVEEARKQVAGLINCTPNEIVFTSGGTESNNQAILGAAFAIRGAAYGNRARGNHIITSTIEHPAVLQVCAYLETMGFEVTYLPVDGSGMVDMDSLATSITSDTILITIMHANNEVGTIQPIEEIAELSGKRGITITQAGKKLGTLPPIKELAEITGKKGGILFHSDAAQSVGKIPVDVNDLGVDMLSIAGHKVYAPKGVGALYVREGVKLEKFLHGAGQERGWRPGTENVLEIVGLGKACEIAGRDLEKNARYMKEMRELLYRELSGGWKELRVNGHPEKRLPNTLNVSFRGIEANKLLAEIGDQVAASAGAACHSGGVDVSAVLRAMEVPLEWAKGTVRFSTGRMTTRREIEGAVEVIVERLINM
jgi:cysteine desulfurase